MKDRWLYPAAWEELAWQCKECAGWCCEHCGVAQGTQAVSERTGVVYIIHLVAAHLDHDPWNEHPRLAALCPTCHARYDCSYRERERERRVELEQIRHQVWVNQYVLQELDEIG